jgi:hypothetical protein
MKPFPLLFTILLLMGIYTRAFGGTYEQELDKLSAALGASLEGKNLKTVAVLNFKDINGKETNLGKLLIEDISVDLVNQNKGVSVIDRTNLNRIMEEHKLTEEGLVAPENARQLKLVGIDAIILGTIIPFEDTYRIDVKAIATDTAQLVVAKRASISKTDNLDSLMGIKKVEKVSVFPLESPNTDTASADQQGSGTENIAVPKKKVYDLGPITVEITSVEYWRRLGKVRVSYSVTCKQEAGNGYDPLFIYHFDNEGRFNAYASPPETGFSDGPSSIVGGATDNNGNTYTVISPQDAKTMIPMPVHIAVGFQLEYQISKEDIANLRNASPAAINFTFSFYTAGQVRAGLTKFSVNDYVFDKVH